MTSCRIDRLSYHHSDSDQEPELRETDQESERRGNVLELPVAETILATAQEAETTSVTDREVETTSEMI